MRGKGPEGSFEETLPGRDFSRRRQFHPLRQNGKSHEDTEALELAVDGRDPHVHLACDRTLLQCAREAHGIREAGQGFDTDRA
jgi:hypothetical protein